MSPRTYQYPKVTPVKAQPAPQPKKADAKAKAYGPSSPRRG
jgi:hypothetical protein